MFPRKPLFESTGKTRLLGEAFELFAGFGGSGATLEAKKLPTLMASLGMAISDEEKSSFSSSNRPDLNRPDLNDRFLTFFFAVQMENHVNLKESFRNEWMLRCIIDVSIVLFWVEHMTCGGLIDETTFVLRQFFWFSWMYSCNDSSTLTWSFGSSCVK